MDGDFTSDFPGVSFFGAGLPIWLTDLFFIVFETIVLRLGFLASSPEAVPITGCPIALGPVDRARIVLSSPSAEICKFSLCRVFSSA